MADDGRRDEEPDVLARPEHLEGDAHDEAPLHDRAAAVPRVDRRVGLPGQMRRHAFRVELSLDPGHDPRRGGELPPTHGIAVDGDARADGGQGPKRADGCR